MVLSLYPKLNNMKRLIELVFGVRVNGEPVEIVNCIKVRETNFSEFEKWCREFNVGCRSDKSNYSFIH